MQDLAALNKMELLCWDGWALADRDPEQAVSVKDAALLDQVAFLTQADNPAFPEMRALYKNEGACVSRRVSGAIPAQGFAR